MEPMPTERNRALVIALAVVGGALVTALVGGGLWALSDARKPAPPKQSDITPAEETQAATVPTTSSAEQTGAVPSDAATSGTSGTSAAPSPQVVVGARKIAYRSGDRIWVADEDGSDAVAVAPGAETYALSADGRQLAVISDTPGFAGRVTVYEVASGKLRMGGSKAYPESLSFSPDGKRIAYSSGNLAGSAVRVMDRNGSGDRQLASPGAMAAFSPDGRSVAYRQSAQLGVGDAVRVIDAVSGSAVAVAKGGSTMSFGWAPAGELYFGRPADTGSRWEVWRSKRPFSSSTRIGSLALTAPAYALCELYVSPNGRHVLTGARGDDGHCRVWVLDTRSGEFSRLTTRRDATPYGWSSDGRMLYFEGNQFQGEPTALMSARADGTGRRVLVEGASR